VRTIAETAAVKALQFNAGDDPAARAYDFYRCYACRRVITRQDELRTFTTANGDPLRICACGSLRYSPSWPVGLEWARPHVAGFVLKLLLARKVAPFAERRAPFLMPIVEKLVSS
jgi:hypothetical protein